MAYQIPITISEAIRKIEADQILLPAFQREFKWSYLNIEHLFDSLMRNYPIGLFVFWKVEKELAENYRFYSFSKEYKEEHETYCHEIFYFRIYYSPFFRPGLG